ncbi:MAG: hypothetical protein V1649_00410 [Patescibacteria group bacterium]
MPEINKQFFKQEKPEIPEREREMLENEIISYEEFRETSKRLLKQEQEDPESIDCNHASQVIERIIESLPKEEIKGLCREIFYPSSDLEKTISLLRDAKKENFEILKEKTEKWVKLIVEEFREKRNKDFSKRDSRLARHLWATPLHTLKGIIEIVEEERI